MPEPSTDSDSDHSTPTATPTKGGTVPTYPPFSFPLAYRYFPRTSWATVPFVYPVYLPGDILFKAQWAGREASRKWFDALDAADLSLVDEVDLAVAVWDKVYQLLMLYTDEWMVRNEKLIRVAWRFACHQIASRFPNDLVAASLTSDTTRELVSGFVRAVLPYAWMHGCDTLGDPPKLTLVDSGRFLDRYIPKPEDLPPREFLKCDPDNEYPDMPRSKWFNNREVPPPDGPVRSEASVGRGSAAEDGEDVGCAEREVGVATSSGRGV